MTELYHYRGSRCVTLALGTLLILGLSSCAHTDCPSGFVKDSVGCVDASVNPPRICNPGPMAHFSIDGEEAKKHPSCSVYSSSQSGTKSKSKGRKKK
ncbi:MAG: hypothetical protein OXC44_02880 [Proteobacteria bacterium]|nr:hypothetical protein [Pseudomonadota bacterium]